MAYQYTMNYDTHLTPTKSLSLIPVVTTDFAPYTKSGNRTTIVNTTSALGKEELVTYEYRLVKNIYANTSIDPSLWTPTKRGVNLFIQVKDIATASDAEDATKPVYDSPFKASVSVQIPMNELVTDELIEAFFCRLAGAIYANGLSQWAKLARGSTDLL